MRYTFAGLLGGSEPEWAYHATSWANMPGIKAEGLIPSVNEGLVDEYVSEGKDPDTLPEVTYFLDDPEGTLDYGDIVLRFPRPDDAKYVGYEWGTEGEVTFKPVPPNKIEFRLSESDPWQPISEWSEEPEEE